jgi:hypothetical protein
VIRNACTAATETNNVSVFWGTQEQTQALSNYALRRPASWGIAARYVETEPRIDPSWRALGALDFYTSDTVTLHRDERLASVALHSAKANVLQTIPGRAGAYLAIEKGGCGWRNMTADASYQYAAAVRSLMVFLAAVTDRAQNYVGQDMATNTDGTIAEREASIVDGELTTIGQRGRRAREGRQLLDAAGIDRDRDRGPRLPTRGLTERTARRLHDPAARDCDQRLAAGELQRPDRRDGVIANA